MTNGAATPLFEGASLRFFFHPLILPFPILFDRKNRRSQFVPYFDSFPTNWSLLMGANNVTGVC